MNPYHDQDGATIYHGEALAALASLANDSVDALVTDPPYSSGGQFRGDRTASTREKYVDTRDTLGRLDFAGDNRDQRSFGYWCALWLAECLRIVKPSGTAALFADWRQLPTTTDALQAGGWVWRGVAAWDKTEAARPRKGAFRNQCEFLAWGTNGAARADGPCLPGVWRASARSEERHHIAAKPESVMKGVLAIVPAGGVVLDPFMGSGTTLVAARDLGLRAIGIETIEANCEIAAKRLAQGVLFA